MSKSIYINNQARKKIQELEESKLDLTFECSSCILKPFGVSCGECGSCSISKKLDDIDKSILYWKNLLDDNV